jgi:hypothetical protein
VNKEAFLRKFKEEGGMDEVIGLLGDIETELTVASTKIPLAVQDRILAARNYVHGLKTKAEAV